ncbi:hypothetical protein [Frankia sp. EAN1pec]|uniref:hypothetical protein n=1 Tax=Parafrankia sp. (strain EAN1pec) TaxID=298653 RepID=UPI000054101E
MVDTVDQDLPGRHGLLVRHRRTTSQLVAAVRLDDEVGWNRRCADGIDRLECEPYPVGARNLSAGPDQGFYLTR